MQSVGHNLEVEAMKRPADENDLFARSAFNRYYYNLFLSVRVVLSGFDPSYSKIGHKDYPNVLSGTLIKEFQKIGKQANKLGDYTLYNETKKAVHAAKELAGQMTEANAIRIVADYYPETKIQFGQGGRYSLNSYSISKAHNWDRMTSTHLKTIEAVLRQTSV